jgi:hypothetical protein
VTDPDHIWNATPNVKIQPRNHHFNNTTKQKLIYIIPNKNKNKQNIGAKIRTAQLKTIMIELEAMAHWMYLAPIQSETFLVGTSTSKDSPKQVTQPISTRDRARCYIDKTSQIYIEYHTPIYFYRRALVIFKLL